MGGRALLPESFAEAESPEEVPQSTEALKHRDGQILTPQAGAGCNLFEASKLQKVYMRASITANRWAPMSRRKESRVEYAERPWHTWRGYAEVGARVSTAASRCVALPPGQMGVVVVIAGRACSKGTL